MARVAQKDRSRQWDDVDIDFTLKRVFKKEAFRPLQREIITAAIDGEDIFVQAATSFGKSLCFQLPAFCSKGVTVVISPLLALVTDQVTVVNSLGVPTESITGNTPREKRKAIEADLQCGHPRTRLLYVTPELCQMESFRRILLRVHQNGQLVRVAIDEAHCISEWGHDFRMAYKELTWFKSNLQVPSVPIMALTATATPKVREDIYTYLKFNPTKTRFFSTSTARPNIHYEVQYFSESSPISDEGDDLYSYLQTYLKSMHNRRVLAQIPYAIHGIVYVPLRATADNVASRLSSIGIRAASYHAGLEPFARLRVQAAFLDAAPNPEVPNTSIKASFNIVVATTAFGMGIDMPSIRFVVHYGLPRALESFVQESGRAGRDDKAAQSLMLYTREERDRVMWRHKQDAQREQQKSRAASKVAQIETKTKSLAAMVNYCEHSDSCRHKTIAQYFDGPSGAPGTCIPQVAAPIDCDYACDVCKEGKAAINRRKIRGLASDEQAMQFTQRQSIEHE